ncbi:MAG TPA: phosphoglycerate mutase family protein [Pyrinomonadaceae bacterium]|nr:phosphoglycerate mutase family protein [Pyrinomonadaceae bacterium]
MKSSANALRPRARKSLFALAALSCAVLLAQYVAARTQTPAPSTQDEFKTTTVILIRHAEKADAPAEDPPLNDSGRARAQELARMLANSNVKAIYTSQFLRAKETAEPLAKQLGLTYAPMPIRMSPTNPRQVSEQSIKEITDKIYERAGDTTLVIGHSNTVPEVIRLLGGDLVPKIDEKKFDDLFVVTVYGRGKAKVLHMKYGSSN